MDLIGQNLFDILSIEGLNKKEFLFIFFNFVCA